MRRDGFSESSPSRPGGFAFRQERRDAFTEISARVAHRHQIVVGARLQPAFGGESPDHFLGGAKRQRRVGGNLRREVCHRLIDGIGGRKACDKTVCVGFGAGDESAAEEQILRETRPHHVEEPAVVRARQTVAESPGDRNAECRFRRGDAQVARQRDGAPSTCGDALHVRDRRLGDPFQAVEHLVDAPLVGERVGLRAQMLELGDVGAGDERLAAGAAKNHHTDIGFGIRAIAGVEQRLVHLPRHRVARLRPIERQRGDRTVDRVQRLARRQSALLRRTSPLGTMNHDRDAATPANDDPPRALSGVRVLDVTQFMAGPFCSVILADLGADVIKIEPPGGESTRQMVGAIGSESPAFNAVNRGKRSVVLNLKLPRGRDAFLRMAASIDIVIENNRPGVMRKLGLDYDALSMINPGLIYASISGYGQYRS